MVAIDAYLLLNGSCAWPFVERFQISPHNYMESPMLQKIFALNVPINTSMLNEISDQLMIALGHAFPAYLLGGSADRNIGMKRITDCRQIGYIDTTAYRLNNIAPDFSKGLSLVCDSFKLKKNSFVMMT